MKVIFRLSLFFLFIFSCTKEYDSISNPISEPITKEKIEFTTILNTRLFLTDSLPNPLVVFYSTEDQQAFFDTMFTYFPEFDFDNYQDSIIIGLNYPEKISLSCSFSIDSILVDSINQKIIIISHLHEPLGKMIQKNYQSHFISLPKTDYEITFDEILIEKEIQTGTRILFNDFLIKDGGFETDPSQTTLAVFKNKSEQDHFLSIYPYFMGLDSFPYFSYNDSILVGVVSKLFMHSTHFELVLLEQESDTIYVSANIFDTPTANFPALSQILHFVAIKRAELPFKLKETVYYADLIE
jgi:hypothetical protein